MPRGSGAKKPVQMGGPKDPGAKGRPEDAGHSREDRRAEDLLRLQEQLAGLQEALRRQEARWEAKHHRLQRQMEELMRQSLQPGPGAGSSRSGGEPPHTSVPGAAGGAASPPTDDAAVPSARADHWAAVQGPGLASKDRTQARRPQTPRGRGTAAPGACARTSADSPAPTRHGWPRELRLPDGTARRFLDDREETVFPDGTTLRVHRNGDSTIVFSDGQREVHTAQFQRREHTDGTVRTVYRDGRQETKFPSGRVTRREPAGLWLQDAPPDTG